MDLSSGDEIRLYYEAAMEYFVNTGRVEFLKLCEYEGDFTDLSNNRIVDTQKKSSFNIRVRQKIVDATYLSPEIPSRHILPFQVSSGVNPGRALSIIQNSFHTKNTRKAFVMKRACSHVQ